MGVVAAERIKITSTRSPWWCTGLVIALSLGIALAIGLALGATDATTPPPNSIAGVGITGFSFGVPGLGYLLLMVLAALQVTSEYRFGTIKTTFLATPARAIPIGVKAGLIGAFAALLAAVLTLLSYLIIKVLGGTFTEGMSLADGGGHVFWAVPVFVFLAVVLAVAVGALVRQSAGALAILLIWPVVVEPLILLPFLGDFARETAVLMPFQNAGHFLGTASDSLPWHWGTWGSLVYFAGFVALVFSAALAVITRRDA